MKNSGTELELEIKLTKILKSQSKKADRAHHISHVLLANSHSFLEKKSKQINVNFLNTIRLAYALYL